VLGGYVESPAAGTRARTRTLIQDLLTALGEHVPDNVAAVTWRSWLNHCALQARTNVRQRASACISVRERAPARTNVHRRALTCTSVH
jgi:hypothetical protein